MPCFACYDNTTRVAEFEFAGENLEALEISVSKALIMPADLQRQLALELLPELIESLLQHVMSMREGQDMDAEPGEPARPGGGQRQETSSLVLDEQGESSGGVAAADV